MILKEEFSYDFPQFLKVFFTILVTTVPLQVFFAPSRLIIYHLNLTFPWCPARLEAGAFSAAPIPSSTSAVRE